MRKVMPPAETSPRRSPACVSCPSGASLDAGPVKTPDRYPVAPIALQTPYGAPYGETPYGATGYANAAVPYKAR